MIVKIFLPENVYYSTVEADLYGEVSIEEKSISYFVVADRNSEVLRKLGTVSSTVSADCEFALKFTTEIYADHIFLTGLSIKIVEESSINIILYNESQILCLEPYCTSNTDDGSQNDIVLLKDLVESSQRAPRKFSMIRNLFRIGIVSMLFTLLNKKFSRISGLLSAIFCKTAVYEHFADWRRCWKHYDLRSGKLWTIFFDVLAGVIIMICILYVDEPSQYLMKLSNYVIIHLRSLLHSLKGSPVGLKLNVQLNNFLLDCFIYHVDLWATFLLIVAPAIQYLFIPIAVLGFFGLSFQLAMLSDLIDLISLHAHCFYIYAAVLYNLEIVGMRALWNVVLGRRKNVLKDRVESHDYMNRQLYLATMFFTTLLFLMPTVLVYYIVFASLRSCIYLITYCLMKLRRKILVFPVQPLIKWAMGCYMDISSIDIELIDTVKRPGLPVTTVLRLQMDRSSPWKNKYWRSWNVLESNFYLPINEFFVKICKGQIMGFMQPKTNI